MTTSSPSVRFAAACNALLTLTFGLSPPARGAELRARTFYDGLVYGAELGTTIESEWAQGFAGTGTQKLESVLEPELEVGLPLDSKLTFIGRLRGDVFDELEPGAPAQGEIAPISRRLLIGDRVDAQLRELTIETEVGPVFLSVGKQQIVWGQADGLKLLDVVNPQEFREFILDSFDDSRIPLWSLDAEVPIGDVTAQIVWLPDQTYHDLPDVGAPFEFTSPLLIPRAPPNVDVRIAPFERPKRVIADSDVGGRLYTFWNGWDLTANYLYHYHDIPVLRRTISIDLLRLRGVVDIRPGYERTHLAGGTFSTALGSFTVRGEVAYSFDRFFSTLERSDRDGVFRTGEFAYVLGLDYQGISETFVSAQLFQSALTRHEDAVIRDRLETNATFFVRRELLNDRLACSLIVLASLDLGDGIFRPMIDYEVWNDLRVGAGVDWFFGTRRGIFGEFDDNDRFVLSVLTGF